MKLAEEVLHLMNLLSEECCYGCYAVSAFEYNTWFFCIYQMSTLFA